MLPNKPSELIRLALADLEKVEAKPSVYEVFMGDWHVAKDEPEGRLCQVCLAGAVLANTLHYEPTVTVDPFKLEDRALMNKLLAIDSLRTGDLSFALEELELDPPDFEDAPDFQSDFDVVDYRNDPAQFKLDMKRLADMCERWGL